jgi:hypothetical protein
MNLQIRAFATAAGIVAAALFTRCAAFLAVAPATATNLFSAVLHLDLTALARPVTVGAFVGGLVFWSVGTAVVFGAAAAIYNRLAGAGATRQA